MSEPETLWVYDPRFLNHRPGRGHPESPARLSAVVDVLSAAPLPGLRQISARSATSEQLQWIHTAALVQGLLAKSGQSGYIDADTVLSEDSVNVACLAAGAAIEGALQIWRGEARNGFVLLRPPGHHAEPNRAMGFCLFNNMALAAEALIREGAQRVLILDWDVHHGNGTQAAFLHRSDVLYMSCHQFPFYPGTGSASEIGTGDGLGYTVNVGMPGGQTDADYGAVFHDFFLPIAQAYRPDVILVSAGFDPHAEDPIGGMRLSERGFAAMSSALLELAKASCQGKLLLLLEGGYALGGLSRSVHACLEILTGRRRESFPSGVGTTAARAIAESRSALAPYWKLPR
ncbi:MAG: histone deacetylase [Myxococcaceae bacterium]